ncbi:helix-turn-helix domain-containing protein [Nocardia sp. NBC_00403]|uniref:helix-turn-helix domain-containing protein n=1 Tax=Nocardia sp. NBC_00403 TaxID=2975990 RepID=UPI002E1C5717
MYRASNARARRALDGLPARELDSAHAIAQGLSNAEIAEKLNLSIATVKSHTGRLFTKLAIKKRVQLALLIRDAQD